MNSRRQLFSRLIDNILVDRYIIMKERLYMRFLKLHITYPLITLILCTTQNLNTVLLYLERLLRTDAPTLYTFPNSIGASKLLRTHFITKNL